MQRVAAQMNPPMASFMRGAERRMSVSPARIPIVVLADQSEVATLKPRFDQIRRVADRGIIVTARSDDEHWDLASRYLPGCAGNHEDCVTRSAPCCLVPFGALASANASSRPAGFPRVSGFVAGDTVNLRGHVRTVLGGQLSLH